LRMADERILIIHTWGLGDLILLTPVLEAIFAIHPDIRFDFVIFQKASAEPIYCAAYTGKIFFSSWNLKDIFSVIRRLRKTRYSASLITSGVTAWKGSIFLRMLNTDIIIGDFSGIPLPYYTRKLRFKPDISRTEANYNLFRTFMDLPEYHHIVQKDLFKPAFHLSGDDLSYAEAYLNENFDRNRLIVAIHPGSNIKFKYRRWDKDNFVALISSLKQEYPLWQFLIIAGPDEEEEGNYIALHTGEKYLEKTPLGKIAAIISKCNIMINTDSGLGHIASCFGLRIFTIFGPGDERQTAPFLNNAIVIRDKFPCAPCVNKPVRKCAAECLKSVTPARVFEVIKDHMS